MSSYFEDLNIAMAVVDRIILVLKCSNVFCFEYAWNSVSIRELLFGHLSYHVEFVLCTGCVKGSFP